MNVRALRVTGSSGRGRSSSDRGAPGVAVGGSAGHSAAFRQMTQDRLSSVLRNRELNGYPINIPFTDMDEVVEVVKAMSIHESNHPEVQFVFAVKAVPYVNGLISLWLFLGALEVYT